MRHPSHISLQLQNTNISILQQYWAFQFLSNIANKETSSKEWNYCANFLSNNTISKSKNKTAKIHVSVNPWICIQRNEPRNKITYHNKTNVSTLHVKSNVAFRYNFILNIFSKYFCQQNVLLQNKTMQKQIHFRFSNKNNSIAKPILFLYQNACETSTIKDSHYLMHQSSILLQLHNVINLQKITKNSNHTSKTTTEILTFFFIRKEKTYTKLKYSRVPQYDTSSNASAALLAGLLGFIISEKFGFEMVDAGDLYILGMYILLMCFTIRIFFKTVENNTTNIPVYSFRWSIKFVSMMLIYLFSRVMYFINRVYLFLFS